MLLIHIIYQPVLFRVAGGSPSMHWVKGRPPLTCYQSITGKHSLSVTFIQHSFHFTYYDSNALLIKCMGCTKVDD